MLILLFAYVGKKTIWNHNLYGLSPNMGSAHQLLVIRKFQALHVVFELQMVHFLLSK